MGLRTRTSPGRLNVWHELIVNSLQSNPATWRVLDLGVGEDATTTHELLARLGNCAHPFQLTAVDRQLELLRARTARPWSENIEWMQADLTDVRGQFDAVLCLNLLRNVQPEQARAMRHHVQSQLSPSGLLLEGTTDRAGNVAIALACSSQSIDAWYFYTDGSRGFHPRMFRDVLPSEWRRTFLRNEYWMALEDAWSATSASRDESPVEHFTRSALILPPQFDASVLRLGDRRVVKMRPAPN